MKIIRAVYHDGHQVVEVDLELTKDIIYNSNLKNGNLKIRFIPIADCNFYVHFTVVYSSTIDGITIEHDADEVTIHSGEVYNVTWEDKTVAQFYYIDGNNYDRI